jgi:hypothetical protein
VDEVASTDVAPSVGKASGADVAGGGDGADDVCGTNGVMGTYAEKCAGEGGNTGVMLRALHMANSIAFPFFRSSGTS